MDLEGFGRINRDALGAVLDLHGLEDSRVSSPCPLAADARVADKPIKGQRAAVHDR